MHDHLATLATRGGRVEISDGCVTMADRDPDATLQVRAPERVPLGEHEPVIGLVLTGDDLVADVELDGAGLDALADAIHDLQAALQEGVHEE